MNKGSFFLLSAAGVGIYASYRLMKKSDTFTGGAVALAGFAAVLTGCLQNASEPIIDYRPPANTGNVSDPSVRGAFCRFLERCDLREAVPGCWSKPAENQCDRDLAHYCVKALDGMPCKDGGLPVDCIQCLKT
jgi:hypothetical protein